MRAARLGIAVLMLGSLGACSSDDSGGGPGPSSSAASQSAGGGPDAAPSASPAPAGPPVAGAAPLPEAGQCWLLSAEELDEGMALVSTAAAATGCAEAHNAVSVAVVGIGEQQAAKLHETVTAGSVVDAAHEETWRAVVEPACAPAFADAFGSAAVPLEDDTVAAAYKASTLDGYAWLPTDEQWQSGARWIRCDIADRSGAPIPFDEPAFDLQTVPTELVACLNANAEGTFPVPCDDPLANAQTLVTIELTDDATTEAKADYDAFKTDAAALCADAGAAAFPNAGKPALAALPIDFAFDGTLDCYVERAPGDPLVTG